MGTNIIIIIIIIVITTIFFLAYLACFSSSLLFLSPCVLTRQRPNPIHSLHMSSVSLFILPLIYLLLSPRHEDQCLFISEPQQGLCHSPSILSSHHHFFPLIITLISLLPQANTGLIFASPAFFFALTGIFSLCTIRQALLLRSMQITPSIHRLVIFSHSCF